MNLTVMHVPSGDSKLFKRFIRINDFILPAESSVNFTDEFNAPV